MNSSKEKHQTNHGQEPNPWLKISVATLAFLTVFTFFLSISHRFVVFKSDLLAEVLPRVLIDLTNSNRQSSSLGFLTESPVLKEAAQRKANDMASKGYFSHNGPDGTTPWQWIRGSGYDFLYAGENLAVNFSDSSDVVRAWMDSPGHRANILSEHFTEIGIATSRGTYQGRETIFVVQMFGQPRQLALQSNLGSLGQTENNPLAVRELFTEEGENEKFVAVESSNAPEVIDTSEETLVAGATEEEQDVVKDSLAVAYSNILERLLVSPSLILSIVYVALGVTVIFLMLLAFLVEVRKHHYLHIIYGVALLLLIIVMYFVYRASSLNEVDISFYSDILRS